MPHFRKSNSTNHTVKKPKKIKPIKSTRMLIIEHENEYLLIKRPLIGIWPGLWSFLEISLDSDVSAFCQQLNLRTQKITAIDGFRHTFSNYHLDISISHIFVSEKPKKVMQQDSEWFDFSQSQEIGLAAPVSKILQRLL